MTYNQTISTIQSLLESHAMIKTVKNELPTEWLKKTEIEFPGACFVINAGSFNKGREQVYQVQFFFLDKSGIEVNEHEQEVISDQVGIAYDIVELMRDGSRGYSIPDQVSFDTISDGKYEDYLAGCGFTIEITTQSSFDGCDAPTV